MQKKRKFLSTDDCYRLVIRSKETTVAELMKEFNISQATVYRKLSEYRVDGKFKPIKKKKPTKLSPIDINKVIEYARDIDRSAIRRDIIVKFQLPVSKTTLSKYLHEAKIFGRVPPNKIKIDHRVTEHRFEAASHWQKLTLDDWKRFVFIDESGLDNGLGRRRHQWRSSSTNREDHENLMPVPNPTFRFNFFSYVSSHGTGELHFYNRMNSDKFIEVVPIMVQDLKNKFGHSNFKIFLDNARFHKSVQVIEEFNKLDITKYFITLPTYSPDINIIENLWGIMKRRVRDICFREGQIFEKSEYQDLIKREWANIEQEIIENLYKSLPKRMKMIVKANGGPIKY